LRIHSPEDVKVSLEQRTSHLVSPAALCRGANTIVASGARPGRGPALCCGQISSGAFRVAFVEEARSRARGDERLSGTKTGDAGGAGQDRAQAGSRSRQQKPQKQRSSDVGRALRSVYDDTLREDVPDDFMDLLGKLS